MYVGLDSVKVNARKQIEIEAFVEEDAWTFVLSPGSVDAIKFTEGDKSWFEEEKRLARGEYNDWYTTLKILVDETLKFSANLTSDMDTKVREAMKGMHDARAKEAKYEAIILALEMKEAE